MADDQTPKRTIVRQVPLAPSSETDLDPLVKNALETVAIELERFNKKARNDRALDLKEARVLQGYLKMLVDLKKEKRDKDKDTDWSKMSREELIAAVQILIDKGIKA